MKSRLTSLVALALLASACTQQAPTAPSTGVKPTGSQPSAAAPSPDATSAPAVEQTGPTESGAPGTAAPAPTAAPVATGTATLRGSVYDDGGAVLSEGSVVVKSLSANAPFESTVPVVQGSYVVNGAPAGVPIEVTVRRDGWTSRTRVTSLLPLGTNVRPNMLNFGGSGDAYFLSRYPEIVSVDPDLDATKVAADKLTYRLVLSEPLDATNRMRFERALRVIPANDAANGGTLNSTSDLTAQEDNGLPLNLLVPYAIKRGSTFLDSSERAASVSWSADGKIATLTFDAPLITHKKDGAKYQVVLISDGTAITDRENKQLGTDENGSRSRYPAAGEVVRSVFKPASLSLNPIAGLSGAEAAWAATHLNAASFEVDTDTTAPTLVSVSSKRWLNDTRIALTFSEPMTAYNDTLTGFASASLADLSHYTFAVAKRASSLDGVRLKGDVPIDRVIDPSVTTSWGDGDQAEREFRFDAAIVAPDRASATQGQILVEVDPLDAKRVLISIIDVPNFFPTTVGSIKARVEGVQDPAGNGITSALADRSIRTGSL